MSYQKERLKISDKMENGVKEKGSNKVVKIQKDRGDIKGDIDGQSRYKGRKRKNPK